MYAEKYQATGNDFIFLNHHPSNPSAVAINVCDRHFGIGADGLIYPEPSTHAEIAMKYFNSDGTEAPMCGNGLRAFARFVYAQKMVQTTRFNVETLGGVFAVEIEKNSVAIDLKTPVLSHDAPDVPKPTHMRNPLRFTVDKHTFDLHVLTLGTLHGVVFVVNDDFDFHRVGHALSTHPHFSKGINVNFVRVLDENTLSIRTYERGAGATLSCGTGVAASAYVAHTLKKTASTMGIKVPGGQLEVTVKASVILTGPAEKIATIELQERQR